MCIYIYIYIYIYIASSSSYYQLILIIDCKVNKKFWGELIGLLSLHMELNLSKPTLTSFNSINVTEFTAVNNLVDMVTMEHKQSKLTV
jgi:hypothetical protein